MTPTFDISWSRILAEGTAIVISILLAFSIEAWWQDRSERARAHELLEALEAEWAREIVRIDINLAQYDKVVDGMVRYIDAHANSEGNLTQTEAIEIVSGHYGWSTYKPSIAAYEIVIAYGLDRIEDPKLRLALASWPSALDEIAPEQEALHSVSLLDSRKEISRVADSFERPWYDSENSWYGVPAGEMALALIRDHGAVRVQRRALDLMRQYRAQLRGVRETLVQNLETLENRYSANN